MTLPAEKKFYTEINLSQQNLIKLVIHLNLTAWSQSFQSFYNTGDTTQKSRNLISQKPTTIILRSQHFLSPPTEIL